MACNSAHALLQRGPFQEASDPITAAAATEAGDAPGTKRRKSSHDPAAPGALAPGAKAPTKNPTKLAKVEAEAAAVAAAGAAASLAKPPADKGGASSGARVADAAAAAARATTVPGPSRAASPAAADVDDVLNLVFDLDTPSPRYDEDSVLDLVFSSA